MRKALIGFALFLVVMALPAAQTAVLPARRPMGSQKPGRGWHGRREAERRGGVHESARNRIPGARLLGSGDRQRQAARVDPDRARGTNGLIIRRGYIVAEFGDTLRPDPTYSVAKSMLVDGCRHRSRSRADSESRQPGRERREGRRIRLASEQPGHVAPPSSAGLRVGRRDVGQERQLHRARGVRPRRR